eukprot:scaffold11264_cov120-Isochrysis_galbana.AAC.3
MLKAEGVAMTRLRSAGSKSLPTRPMVLHAIGHSSERAALRAVAGVSSATRTNSARSRLARSTSAAGRGASGRALSPSPNNGISHMMRQKGDAVAARRPLNHSHEILSTIGTTHYMWGMKRARRGRPSSSSNEEE